MYNIYSKGKLRADKVEYRDGIGCCIWYPFDEDVGVCFDFDYEDIDDMISLLGTLKKVKPDKFEDEEE